MHGLGRCCASPSGFKGQAGQRRSLVPSGPGAAADATAPEIIEAIMGGRQPARMTMAGLLIEFPVGWAEQRAAIGLRRKRRCHRSRAPT